MGDALVSGLVSDVVRKLTSIVSQEIGLLRRLEEDVLNLTNDFNKIQAVIHDAEDKQFKDEVVKLWLKSLRSASLHVENVLEEVSTEALLHRLHKERGTIYRVSAFFSSDHNQLMVQTNIAHKVKAITKKIADLAKEKDKFNLTPVTTSVDIDAGVTGEMPNRETSSLVHKSMIYGRDEEMEMVTEKICSKDINKDGVVDDMRVYAIWGMGGLGKTTLAQLVYNHERVNDHFELKCWRYVSEKFQVKEIIKGLIESMDKRKCELSQLDDLQRSLQEKVQGKRFLVVLDDVWIEESEKSEWEKLRITLSSGAEGSFIIVTTRNQTTSEMVAKDPKLQHQLGCLSEVDSWSLFEKLAFAGRRKGEDRRELESIGKEIVKKCKGLPLAVNTLGGMMWSKSSRNDWERVMASDIWQLQKNDILPALKLSYDNLLPHLKRCFSYCCLFPKGYEMKKDLIILLWMANGFIPPRGEADLYVLGEEVYNYLVWRSFFQFVDEKYRMHDLMHDLAQYVMGHDCSIIEPGKKVITPENVLHLSSSFSEFDFSNKDLKCLRSVFIFQEHVYNESISPIFDFVNLRVLFMVNLRSNTLPESICKLKFLKYLNLSGSPDLEVLPKSIIYLQNLQVLILEECWYLRKLPEGIRYMRNLQHLNIKGCWCLKYLPVGILKGVDDVRLTHFRVDEKKGAKIGELVDVINFVDGKLEINGLQNVKGGLEEGKTANLKSKKNLLVLNLKWWYYDTKHIKPERIVHDEEVLEGLEPNPGLKELRIEECYGKNISPSWIVNLNNLVNIFIDECRNCENVPPLGKLPLLRNLILERLPSLKRFHDEDYNTSKSGDNTTTTLFPALYNLHINYCPNLVSLPSYFPNLYVLHIEDCESLHSLPDEIQTFKNLNELYIFRCKNLERRYEKETGGVDWPKIAHVPDIRF